MPSMLVFSGEQIVLPGQAEPCPATIEVDRDTGKITKVHEKAHAKADYPSDAEFVQLKPGQILLPGLVDVHVHLNAPGREQWEGFKTGTQAAASGGVTTLVDMPLNSIPSTTTTSNLKQKTDRAKDSCYIDVAFWGGVVPDNSEDLVPLIDAGVKGFKCFLCNSGVDEFRHVEEADLHRALPKIQHKGRKMLFHAELGDRDEESSNSHREYSTFLKTSPESMEESAIALVARLTEQYAPIQTHIVHLSASSALPILREARRVKKLPLSVETCIHYLTLEAEVVPEGRTDYKCCPPIRGRANRDALWQALLDEDIDFIVSDHSPCTADLKRLDEGNFLKAWGGIGGLGLGVSLLYTECRKRGISICKLVEWMSSKPAKWIGLDGQKGGLQVGADADLVIFDTNNSFEITTNDLYFKNKVSPYTGMQVDGRVLKTYLRGQVVFNTEEADPFIGKAKGSLLL